MSDTSKSSAPPAPALLGVRWKAASDEELAAALRVQRTQRELLAQLRKVNWFNGGPEVWPEALRQPVRRTLWSVKLALVGEFARGTVTDDGSFGYAPHGAKTKMRIVLSGALAKACGLPMPPKAPHKHIFSIEAMGLDLVVCCDEERVHPFFFEVQLRDVEHEDGLARSKKAQREQWLREVQSGERSTLPSPATPIRGPRTREIGDWYTTLLSGPWNRLPEIYAEHLDNREARDRAFHDFARGVLQYPRRDGQGFGVVPLQATQNEPDEWSAVMGWESAPWPSGHELRVFCR